MTRQAVWQQQRIARGLCPICGKPSDGMRCEVCRPKDSARHRPFKDSSKLRMRALRDARRAESLCIYCGAEVEKFTRCLACRRARASKDAARKARKRALEAVAA